jgi:hypothetical protein
VITSRSAALHRPTRLEVLRDPNRGRAIAAFHDAGMTLREIADALNCSEPVLNILLLELIRSVRRIDSPSLERAPGLHHSPTEHPVLPS